MGVSIQYNNYASGAKECFVPEAQNVTSFSSLDFLQKFNVFLPKYANPCESYQTALDDTSVPLPDSLEDVGIWSANISDSNGLITPSVELSLVAEELFSSQGITIEFDKYNNIYCNQLTIKWYRDGVLLDEKSYTPTSPVFVCDNAVEHYNQIDITFERINMPQNYLKIVSINYGYEVEFTGTNLKNAKLTQEIDPISTEISINTGDFTAWVDVDFNLFFREKEPLTVYFNNDLRAKLFIKSAKRTAKKQWTIQAEDYIGLLDNITFYGGVYENKDAKELLDEIFSVAKIPYEMDRSLIGRKVSGHIPYGTCREALMQVVFAISAVADTSNSNVVKIYALTDEISQTISLNRIMQGQSFVNKKVVTGVSLTAHSYRKAYEKSQTYNADKSGVGNGIFVKFSSPSHSPTITNGRILESGANYAIINIFEGGVLTYWNYEHEKVEHIRKNPLVNFGIIENTVSIDNATLVSNENVDNILERCYNYIVNANNEVNLKIVESSRSGHKPVNVGDYITTQTEYLGEISGRVIKQSYSLNGGILVKDTVIK